MGFTFDAHPQSFGQFISTWKPTEVKTNSVFSSHIKMTLFFLFVSLKNFGEPHDLALNVNGRSLFVGEIHPNRIDTFDVIN